MKLSTNSKQINKQKLLLIKLVFNLKFQFDKYSENPT